MIISPILSKISNAIISALNTADYFSKRWAYNFDGIDDRGQLAFRAIDPDGDIDIEFYTPSDVSAGTGDKFIVTQNISTSPSNSEFLLFISGATGNLGFCIGGTVAGILLAGEFTANQKMRVTYTGSTRRVFDGEGNLLREGTTVRGSVREPTAQTVIGARTNGTVGTYARYAAGIQRDVKINGVLYPIADRNQSIQLPLPSGLGAELITQNILENPASKASQWTYLGEGRWQLQGTGAYESLRFISDLGQVVGLLIEFEVESITGTLRLNPITAGYWAGTNIVNQVGKYRLYSNSSVVNNIEFVRHNSGELVSCVIKNISFKPLGTCNPLTLNNTTPDRWEEIEGTLPNTRFAYNFDGVDDRSQLMFRAIDPDGDIDIEWEQFGVILGTTRHILSQCDTASFGQREVLLRWLTTGALSFAVGNAGVEFNNSNFSANGLYRLFYSGSTATLFVNGVLMQTVTYNRGAAREPSAPTRIATRSNAGSFVEYFRGVLYNLKINGVLWPIDDTLYKQQLPNEKFNALELLTNNTFNDLATDWGTNAAVLDQLTNGIRLTNTSTTAARLSQTINTVAGQMYVVDLNCGNYLGGVGTCRLSVCSGTVPSYTGDITNNNFIAANSRSRFVFTANSSQTTLSFYVNHGAAGASIDFNSVSCKALYATTGINLVPNGNFSSGIAGWLQIGVGGTVDTSGGSVVISGGTSAGIRGTVTGLEAGKTYELSFIATNPVVDRPAFFGVGSLNNSTLGVVVPASAVVQSYLITIPAGSTNRIEFGISGDGTNTTWVFDNISLKEITEKTNMLLMTNTTPDRWVEVLE